MDGDVNPAENRKVQLPPRKRTKLPSQGFTLQPAIAAAPPGAAEFEKARSVLKAGEATQPTDLKKYHVRAHPTSPSRMRKYHVMYRSCGLALARPARNECQVLFIRARIDCTIIIITIIISGWHTQPHTIFSSCSLCSFSDLLPSQTYDLCSSHKACRKQIKVRPGRREWLTWHGCGELLVLFQSV